MTRPSGFAKSTSPQQSRNQRSAGGRTVRVTQADLSQIDRNPQFQQAVDLVERQGESLFITGKAGTGKSTLLHYLRSTTSKETVVLAPTGVAALNVGGQTIHSFFRLPPTLIEPRSLRRQRNTKLFEKLEMLIIDEVSMVRADVMDGVDTALRLYRNKPQIPFGGVQVVLCGDLFQLPPIVRDGEMKAFFDERYGGPYFFLAHVFADLRPYALELTTIYRQRDDAFINVLNKIREHDLDAELFAVLNQRVLKPNTSYTNGFITLTTTNDAASRTNRGRLEQINAKLHVYAAAVAGDFDPTIFPTDEQLELKRGAQVMMIRNDPEKRWVNGTLGTVSVLNEKKVCVEISGTSYEVAPETWKNIRYHFNREKNQIEEEVVGTFIQYPLRLAWAITIHKSQGQTFDNVLIDLGRGSFAHGQTYVALSRCRSLEGIVFSRPVMPRDILFDERVYGYSQIFQPVPRG